MKTNTNIMIALFFSILIIITIYSILIRNDNSSEKNEKDNIPYIGVENLSSDIIYVNITIFDLNDEIIITELINVEKNKFNKINLQITPGKYVASIYIDNNRTMKSEFTVYKDSYEGVIFDVFDEKIERESYPIK